MTRIGHAASVATIASASNPKETLPMTPAWIVAILLALLPACLCGGYWLGWRMCLEQTAIDAEARDAS